jgi:hypothetical protein
MNHPTRTSRKRFCTFLLESISSDPSVVQFQVQLDPPPIDPVEALLFALDKASWIISGFGIEDGQVVLRPFGDNLGITGWEFLVIAPDAKAASLLNASLLNGYLGESVTMHQQNILSRLLGESGWRRNGTETQTASQRWYTLNEIRRGL